MPAIKLTAAAIPGLRAKDDRREDVYRDTVVRGLLLEVHPSGVRTFVAWYRIRGTDRGGRLTLGRWQPGVYDLADARDDARKALHLAATGVDPAAEKRRTRAAGTFGDLVRSFLEDARHSIRSSSLQEWRLLLEHDRLAGLRSRKTVEIVRGDLVRLFDKIRDDSIAVGGKGYAANHTMAAVRRVFNWAVSKDLVAATPCVGIARPIREQARQRAYTDKELGAIVRALDESATCDGVRLCLFTGVRIEQAMGATWAEVDLQKAEWAIAADRLGNKSGVPWLVPLVPAAVELLERRRTDSPSVFPTKTGGTAWRSQRAVQRVRERSGVEDFRPHDLRRTLNSWLASLAGGAVPQPVRDAILGHRPPRLEGVYNVHTYAQEKRAALERWAAHVDKVVSDESARVLEFPA